MGSREKHFYPSTSAISDQMPFQPEASLNRSFQAPDVHWRAPLAASLLTPLYVDLNMRLGLGW